MTSTVGPYKKVEFWQCQIDGEPFYISVADHNAAPDDDALDVREIEEVRKNGQEDTHLSAVVYLDKDRRWQWSEPEYSEFYEEYGQAVLQFLNDNPLPDGIPR